MNRRITSAAVVASSLMLLTFSNAAEAQNPAKAVVVTKVPDGATVTLEVYPVQDLLLVLKDYKLDGTLVPPTKLHDPSVLASSGGGGGGQPGGQTLFAPGQPPAAQPPTLLDNLKSMIESVDANSWKDNGGATGSITFFDGQLAITQTSENHAAIVKLLGEIRKGRGSMVRLRADWVLMSRGDLDKLLKNGAADTTALPEINRAQLTALPDSTVHFTSQIVCFSGQTVHLASGRVKSLVTGVTPVVAPGSIAMDPSVDFVHFGTSLEINTTVATESATLDLNSVVSQTTDKTLPAATQPATPDLDRVNNLVQNFHTTVQIPLNKPVLIAGATADPTSDQPAGKELYLIVEADTGK